MHAALPVLRSLPVQRQQLGIPFFSFQTIPQIGSSNSFSFQRLKKGNRLEATKTLVGQLPCYSHPPAAAPCPTSTSTLPNIYLLQHPVQPAASKAASQAQFKQRSYKKTMIFKRKGKPDNAKSNISTVPNQYFTCARMTRSIEKFPPTISLLFHPPSIPLPSPPSCVPIQHPSPFSSFHFHPIAPAGKENALYDYPPLPFPPFLSHSI